MKIIILSTDTNHHRYFINSLNKEFPLEALFFETNGLNKKNLFIKRIKNSKGLFRKLYNIIFSPYWQLPLWNKKEDFFEKKQFFKKISEELPKDIPFRIVCNVNDKDSLLEIRRLNPDVIILFGVGRIKMALIKTPKVGILNVHRGIVPNYRGLDSNLWAIYFGDFDNIGVTIHFVDENLDTGDIVFQEKLKLSPADKIYHLRYITTVIATNLVLKALRDIEKSLLKSTPQPIEGGYVSFIPFFFKFKVNYKFWRYKRSLKK